jgi:hypothetical protein
VADSAAAVADSAAGPVVARTAVVTAADVADKVAIRM